MTTPTRDSIPAHELDGFAEKLVRASERVDWVPFSRLAFPEKLEPDRPLMSAEVSSLSDHPALLALNSEARWRFGLLETVNFFSLNIHGEQALVAELVARLYRGRFGSGSPAVSRYLQHFIHEENSHTYMLAEFCNRYYGRVMPEVVSRFETPSLSRAGTDLLFFARVYVLETMLDLVNRACMQDETLDPTVRAVHRAHHVDEARHMAFDRAIISSLALEMRDALQFDELDTVQRLVSAYARYAFSLLANPRVYREAGIPDPLRVMKEIQASPRWRALETRWWHPVETFFHKVNVFQAPEAVPE
jgi:hypothetical protein